MKRKTEKSAEDSPSEKGSLKDDKEPGVLQCYIVSDTVPGTIPRIYY
jgi:hypothetical protein